MSLLEVILNRRSIRKYSEKNIPKDILEKIIEAGRQSPSAANRQPYHFIIVTDQEIKKEISGIFSRFIRKAPIIIIGCANPNARLTGNWATIDTTIALENMVLTATSLEIGTCWIGSFDEQKIKEKLNVPENWKIVALISMGYPEENPKPRKKKETTELFSYNKF